MPDHSPGTESVISHKEESELLSQLSPEILSLVAEVGLTPIPCRGKSQAGVEIVLPDGGTVIVWIGFYPGFCADEAYQFQVSLSTDAKAERFGVTCKGVISFLQTGAIPADRKPIARKGKDLKALRKG